MSPDWPNARLSRCWATSSDTVMVTLMLSSVSLAQWKGSRNTIRCSHSARKHRPLWYRLFYYFYAILASGNLHNDQVTTSMRLCVQDVVLAFRELMGQIDPGKQERYDSACGPGLAREQKS